MEQKELIDIDRMMNAFSFLMVKIIKEIETTHPTATNIYQRYAQNENYVKYSIHFKVNGIQQSMIYKQKELSELLFLVASHFGFNVQEIFDEMIKESKKSLLSVVK